MQIIVVLFIHFSRIDTRAMTGPEKKSQQMDEG